LRADRLLSLMLMLQTKGRMTALELSRELEVSERTIYRDLDALSIAGIPVYTERGPTGGISLLDNYRTSLTGLTSDEVQALFSAILPDPAADLGADATLKKAILKLTAALPARQQNQVESVRQRVHLDGASWFQAEEPTPFLPLIQEAMWEQRRFKMTYRRGDGTWVTRLVSPHGLVAKANIWYMVANIRFGMQVYRVSRIQEATVTEVGFEREVGFDLPAFWQQWTERFENSGEPYAVALRVHMDKVGDLVPAFGEGIHHIVAQAGSPDSGGYLTLVLKFSSYEQALREVVGIGNAGKVIMPPELQAGLRKLAKDIHKLYESE
jgi:predicted DNA-binding transcriptional regulator YafY